MIPSRETLALINQAFSQDTAVWSSDPQTKIALVVSSFVPGPDVDISALTLASFTGSAPIDVPAPPQNIVVDNESGRVGILLKEPVGGYKWICTAAPDPAQTVYGWIVYLEDLSELFFSELLPEPVVITSVGNFVELTATLGYLSMDAYGNL